MRKTTNALFGKLNLHGTAIGQCSMLGARIIACQLDPKETAALEADPALKTTADAATRARNRYLEAEGDPDLYLAEEVEARYEAYFDALWIFCKVLDDRACAIGWRTNADGLLLGIEERLSLDLYY